MSYMKIFTLSAVITASALNCPVSAAAAPLSHDVALAQFSKTLEEIELERRRFHERLKQAKSSEKRREIYREAEKYIVQQIYTRIAPAWLGMPWTMAVIDDGLRPDAETPFEKGKGVSCSWFVVSVLKNAGLKLGNPRAFAGTIALHLQRSLSPAPKDLKRIFHVTPAELEKRLSQWGDGLYIIGLNCHVGFVHVKGDNVTFIHSNYTAPMQQVRMEPLAESEAIALSQRAGYVVSVLFKDTRLIHRWLAGTKVYFNGPRK